MTEAPTGSDSARVIDKIAWVYLRDGRVLGARSHGRDAYYLPGGKREAGESDVATLARELAEELSVTLRPETARHVGTYEAAAHGQAAGVTVRLTCYTGEFDGVPTPSAEVAELVWLGHDDRDRLSAAGRLVLDDLRAAGRLG